MSNVATSLGLFGDEESAPDGVAEASKTGVLPHQKLRAMVHKKAITSPTEIEPDQYQPASLDLRLGRKAYRVRASFLPGPDTKVVDRIEQLDGLPEINLETGALFEREAVYVVELLESVSLNSETTGLANPKSSTGRLDILTRLITDEATAFDQVRPGYRGPLYLEVAPLTFNVMLREGVRLNQVRFQRGVEQGIPKNKAQKHYDGGELVGLTSGPRLPIREGGLVPVTVDLVGDGPGCIVGFKARKHTNRIDVNRVGHYDPHEFWDPIKSAGDRLTLNANEFYILATREDVGVPPSLAAEMVPYDTRSGEFRVHYAGFFDPGFGWADGRAKGSKAVLEVRSYGVSFVLEHGQIVGWLRYAPLAGGSTDLLYGADIKSNYQGQRLALAKQFMPWSPS